MLNGRMEIQMTLMSYTFCKTLCLGIQTTGTVFKGRQKEVMDLGFLPGSLKLRSRGKLGICHPDSCSKPAIAHTLS